MRIGITVGLGARAERTISGLIERAGEVELLGFDSLWMPAAFSFDAITALVAVGLQNVATRDRDGRRPNVPAPSGGDGQALTAQAALGGRFTLGVGLSHKVMMQDAFGLEFEHPAEHLREHLAVLAPLLAGAPVAFHGDQYRVEAAVDIEGAAPVPLLVAAMGPLMLRLAGRLTDGTITSLVGPRTLHGHIVPTIQQAAEAAGRSARRVAARLRSRFHWMEYWMAPEAAPEVTTRFASALSGAAGVLGAVIERRTTRHVSPVLRCEGS